MKPLNAKAENLVAKPPDDVRPYTFGDCCPGFLPGWEVGSNNAADPCPWQSDLPACHPCYWTAQVPDETTYPDWMNNCANMSSDWSALCTVPDV
ncbi:MAG: quinohemoprotein amine dehydrogenase subunit gamma [Deltaproteobacteria bacterium]|nr:quinohemoprotein amine dehydrogenase subunit gamma [Deltaproteobacteria bacterium]